MKKVLVAFCLILFLGGVLFFFLMDFKGQDEDLAESIDVGRTEVSTGNDRNSDLNSSQNKNNVKEIKKNDSELPKPDKESDSEVNETNDSKSGNLEYELDPQYYPSLGGYLKVDGGDIQALEIFFRETESFVINLSFTKVTNSIFQVENSFWNLHLNPDQNSYNVRIGSGPLSGNIVTFTAKKERGDFDNNQSGDGQEQVGTEETEEEPSYEDNFSNNEVEEDLGSSYDSNPPTEEVIEEPSENQGFE